MKKKTTFIILYGAIMALAGYFFSEKTNSSKTEVTQSMEKINQLQNKLNSIDKNYKMEIQHFEKKNDSLQNEVKKTETALMEEKKKVLLLRGNAITLANRVITATDTAQKLKDCDTLAIEVKNLITESNVKDSLCDEEINGLKAIVENRDSVLTVCEKSYLSIKTVADSSIQQQQLLTAQLQIADKHFKKAKFKNKILAAGVMILSGVTASLLLQH